MMTYGVSREHIDGAPSWLDTERFDITATAAADVSPADVTLMVGQLLADPPNWAGSSWIAPA
jgi:uncharacterized protein (TIGR03435 family)